MNKNTIKFISLVVIVFFLGTQTGYTVTYSIECLNHKGKLSPCSASIDSNTLSITYKPAAESSLNTIIQGKNITALTSGEYARRRVAESIAWAFVSPIALFGLLTKKKRDQIGVEYLDTNGKPKATMLSIKKKYSMMLQQELKALSGKPIVEIEPPKKK